MKPEHIEIAEQIARDASCAQGEFGERVLSIIPYLTDVCDRAARLLVGVKWQEEAALIVAHELGNIEISNGRCRWTDVANAQTHIQAQLRALPHTGQPQEGEDKNPLLAASGWLVSSYSCEGIWSSVDAMAVCKAIDAFTHAPAPQAGCAKEGERGDRIDLITKVIDGCAVTQAERDIIVAALRERAARRAGPTAECVPPPPVAESGCLQAVWRAHGKVSVALAHFGAVTTQTQIDPERRREAEEICRDNLREALRELGAVRLPAPPALVAEKETP